MDFRKIARIFILAFGFLNVYLIVNIVGRHDIQDTTLQPTDDDIQSSIEASNITVPDLSSTKEVSENVYSLQVNAHHLLEDQLAASEDLSGTLAEEDTYYVSFHSDPIALKGNPADGFTEADLETIHAFVLSDEVMYGEEYVFHRYDVSGRRFVFYQMVDGLPIADGTSEISLFVNEEGEIYSYEQTYAGPVSRQGDVLNLIDSSRAIEILFLNNEIRQGSEVLVPELTYRRALHLEDLSMYSPIWVVTIDYSSERQTFRVDAVNGTIIRQASAPSDTQNGDSTDDEDMEELENETDADS